MIPRKITKEQRKRNKAHVHSLPSMHYPIDAMFEMKAFENARARHGQREAVRRLGTARMLRAFRQYDKDKKWESSFHADLAATNHALGANINNLVRRKAKNGFALEIGAGAGETVAALQKLNPKTRFSATGITVASEWMGHPNYKSIDWHVAHMENLSRVLKGKQFDFIYSTTAFCKAMYPEKALKQANPLLKIGGSMVFNVTRGRADEFASVLGSCGLKVKWRKDTTVLADKRIAGARSREYTSFFVTKVAEAQ